MTSPWTAALIAVFAWWFFTGIILLVVRRADAGDAVAHGRNVFLSVPLFALGAAGLVVSSTQMTLSNVYIAFVSTLLIWGWIELAFLSGVITGPERRPCPDHLAGRARFVRAWHTVSHHEILLLLAFLVILTITRGAENTVGFWTYTILFVARISAKLNLFLGVPRINIQFLPRPLAHLASYFRIGRITAFFPISVSALTVFSALLLERAINVTHPGMSVGYSLLTCLCLLALLEHWFMVLPLPDEKLWRWMLPATKPQNDQVEDANGL